MKDSTLCHKLNLAGNPLQKEDVKGNTLSKSKDNLALLGV